MRVSTISSSPDCAAIWRTVRPLLHKSGTMIKARCERLGNLDSVHFGETNAEPSPLPDGMVEVEIHAAGISYKDVVVTRKRHLNLTV
jgi:hypothetical protein